MCGKALKGLFYLIPPSSPISTLSTYSSKLFIFFVTEYLQKTKTIFTFTSNVTKLLIRVFRSVHAQIELLWQKKKNTKLYPLQEMEQHVKQHLA